MEPFAGSAMLRHGCEHLRLVASSSFEIADHDDGASPLVSKGAAPYPRMF